MRGRPKKKVNKVKKVATPKEVNLGLKESDEKELGSNAACVTE